MNAASEAPAPKRAWLAFTRLCNLNCRHCFRRGEPRALYPAVHLSPSLFRRLEQQLFPSLEVCRVGGNNLGEQLTSPHFDDFIARMAPYSFRKILLTNGTLLDEARIDVLIGNGWTIDLSLETTDAQRFREIRGRELRPLLETIGRCCRLRHEANGTPARIRLSVSLFHDTLADLPRLVDDAAELGVDDILMSHFLPSVEWQRSQSLVFHKGQANETLAIVREAAASHGINLEAPPPFPITPMARRAGDRAEAAPWDSRPCPHPWTSVSVHEHGTVSQCCVSDTVLGNIGRSSLGAIWRGRGFAHLRRTVNTAPSGWCRDCPVRGDGFTSGQCNDDDAILHGVLKRDWSWLRARREARRYLDRHPRSRDAVKQVVAILRRGRSMVRPGVDGPRQPEP